ncbi:efflux RND transporter periplasmic adaptor subunit [Geminicoccaceae bacterium 1502E]|nr:efflux RND transporter periplasmic adaptor subunit [Geminicoccaceae bacterium 1502E]
MLMKARRGRTGARWLALSASLLLGLAACDSNEEQASSAPPAPPPAVGVVQVASREVTPSASFSGRIEAIQKVELRARVEGFLEKQTFVEGSEVEAGDLLFVIEKAPYQAAQTEAEGSVVGTRGTLKLAELERDRQTTLVKKQAAAQARLDEATAKLAEARGTLMRNEASLDRAKLELSYTDIVAPVAGRIGRASFTVGSLVGPASGPLATIVSQDPIYVTFPVTVRDLLNLRKKTAGHERKPGEIPFKLELADGSTYAHEGRLDFADVEVEQGTDTVLIRGRLPNPDRLLIDGALVNVTVATAAPEAAMVVPQTAVQLDQGGTYVLLVDDENKVEMRRVVLSQRLGGLAVATEGLEAGDRVIVQGLQKVRPGLVVEPTEVPVPPGTAPAAGAPRP